MRELKVIGLDVDGKHIIFEGRDPADKFIVRVDDRLRAAARGDRARAGQISMDIDVKGGLRPRDIQARIRAGASVEQLAAASGLDVSKIERFAHPVLLERSRVAELATVAHPVLADGPAVLTLLETVTSALVARGRDAEGTTWDAWRSEDGRWTVQLAWQTGLSDNVAHFRFTPGAHGGTVTALDDAANELIDPEFGRTLRPVAPVAQLEFENSEDDEPTAPLPRSHQPVQPAIETSQRPLPASRNASRNTNPKRARPAIPAWEDVLLGVRSSGER